MPALATGIFNVNNVTNRVISDARAAYHHCGHPDEHTR